MRPLAGAWLNWDSVLEPILASRLAAKNRKAPRAVVESSLPGSIRPSLLTALPIHNRSGRAQLALNRRHCQNPERYLSKRPTRSRGAAGQKPAWALRLDFLG